MCLERLFSTLLLLKSLCHCFWHPRSHFSRFYRIFVRFLRSRTQYRPDDISRPVDIDFGEFRTRRSRFGPPNSHFRVFLLPPPHFRFLDSRTQPGPSYRSQKVLFRPLHPYRVFHPLPPKFRYSVHLRARRRDVSHSRTFFDIRYRFLTVHEGPRRVISTFTHQLQFWPPRSRFQAISHILVALTADFNVHALYIASTTFPDQ